MIAEQCGEPKLFLRENINVHFEKKNYQFETFYCSIYKNMLNFYYNCNKLMYIEFL